MVVLLFLYLTELFNFTNFFKEPAIEFVGPLSYVCFLFNSNLMYLVSVHGFKFYFVIPLLVASDTYRFILISLLSLYSFLIFVPQSFSFLLS